MITLTMKQGYVDQELLTTGEAAVMLEVSRSTVSRRFDKGELQGRVHPITGERLISRQSVLEVINKYSGEKEVPAPSSRRLILATANRVLAERIRKIVAEAGALSLSSTSFGSDALIACARTVPDLLMLGGGDLCDISCAGVMDALRRQEGKKQPKTLCFCEKQDQCTYRHSEVVPDWTRLSDQEILSRINNLLGVSAHGEATGMDKAKHHSRRRWTRRAVSIPVRIGVYLNRAPRQRFWGSAVVENISRGGAFLNRIAMDNGMLPSEPFRLLVQTDRPPLANWQAKCRVLRLQSSDSVSAGVCFQKLSENSRSQLLALCG